MRFVGSLGEVYEVVAALPADEAGETYLVRDTDGTLATLTILSARLAADDATRARFVERRAQASRAESDAVLVSIDLGEHEGRPFVVHPFVAGVTLRQLLGALHANRRRFHPEVACALVHHLATSLDEVHDTPDERGQPMRLSHGAISTDRVLIGFDGRVGLSGFGIARDLGGEPRDGDVRAIDSRRYAAPEVLRGAPCDTRADIHALAVVLWESLTLRKWQPGASSPAISELVPDAPAALDLAIEHCLDEDPNRRPPSLDELSHLLAMACPLAARVRLARVGDLVSTIVTPERARGRMNLPAEVAERLDGSRRAMDPSTLDELTSPYATSGPCELGDELGKWARVPGRASIPPPVAAGVSGIAPRPNSVRPPPNVRAADEPAARPGPMPEARVSVPSSAPVEANTRRPSVPPPPRISRPSVAPPSPLVNKPPTPLRPRPSGAPPVVTPAVSPTPPRPLAAPLTARPAAKAAAIPRPAPAPTGMPSRVAASAAAMAPVVTPEAAIRAVPVDVSASEPLPNLAPQTAPEPKATAAESAAESRLVPRPRAPSAAPGTMPKPPAPRAQTLAGVAPPRAEPPRPEPAAVAPPVVVAPMAAHEAPATEPTRAVATVALATPPAFVVAAPEPTFAIPERPAPTIATPPVPLVAPSPVAPPSVPVAGVDTTRTAPRGIYFAIGAFGIATAVAVAIGMFHTETPGTATASPDPSVAESAARPPAPLPAHAPLAGSAPSVPPPPVPNVAGLSVGRTPVTPSPEPEQAREERDHHSHHHASSSSHASASTTPSSHASSTTAAATPMAATPAMASTTPAMTTMAEDDDLSFRERWRLRRERRRAD